MIVLAPDNTKILKIPVNKVSLKPEVVRVTNIAPPPRVVIKPEVVRVVKTGRCECESATNKVKMVSFMAQDWRISAGMYYLDLQHDLESENAAIVTLSDDCDVVLSVAKVENYTANKIRIYINAVPEMRFSGTAVILGV